MVIIPYRYAGTWVFDDESVGLDKEPFVAGIPEMIDLLLSELKLQDVNAFRLTFSADEFPGYQEKIVIEGTQGSGTDYRSPKFGRVGWLCPALFHYFDKAPAAIYVRFDPIP